jgi:hypothetical protein
MQGPGPLSWALNARMTTLLCKKKIVTKSKEVKTRCNLAESSKEDSSKRAVLPMMMMIDSVREREEFSFKRLFMP